MPTDSPRPPSDPGTPRSRWLAALAATLLIVATIVLQNRHQLLPAAGGGDQASALHEAPPAPDAVLLIQSRVAVAAARTLEGGEGAGSLLELLSRQLRSSAASDPVALLRLIPVEAQLSGRDAAGAVLEEARAAAGDAPPAWFAEDLKTLEQLLVQGAEPSSEAVERLRERHGWFAQLAQGLAQGPASDAYEQALAAARRSLVAFSSLFLALGLGFVAGLVLLAVALLRMSRGAFVWSYAPSAPGGSVYLETFALFLAAFLVLAPLTSLAEPVLGRASMLLLWLILPLAAWPLVRGSSVAAWRRGLGWTSGRGALREVAAGVAGYCATIPFLVLGVAVMVVLLFLQSLFFAPPAQGQGGGGLPVHPLVQEAAGAGPGRILLILSLASLWAPIVEETFFRGAFYHHLRGRFGPLFSALVTGFVFAAVHPTGLLTIPPLMALGFSFALIRQWRGSIIANATAHSLHNTLVLAMFLYAVS